MAEVKISALTDVTTLAVTDTFPVVQSGTTKEASINKVLNLIPVTYGYALSDEVTPLTAGTAKLTVRIPQGFVLTGFRTSVTTAPTGAALLTVDCNLTGTGTILSTKCTIDASEKTSTTAATPVVISVSAIPDDSELTFDIDTIDTDNVATGLKVYLIGTRTAV